MTPRPPRLAERLVARSILAIDRVAVLGDLAEEFEAIASARGGAAARRWYWRQTLASLAPNLRRRFGNQPPALHPPGGSPLDSLWQDVRYGWRAMRQRPLVTTVALLSLVVGISMSTVVFSLLDAAVLAPLPVRHPEALALVLNDRGQGSINHNFSYPDFVDYRSGQHAFVDLVGYSAVDVTMRAPAGATLVHAELVSGGFFTTLGVTLPAGRGLTDADDQPDAPPVVVVSEGLWRAIAPGAAFDARVITLNERPFTIVGIVDRSFHGMTIGGDARVWAPIHQQPALAPVGGRSNVTRRGASWLSVIGRLRPGVTSEAAAADLNRIEAVLGPSVNRQEHRRLVLLGGGQGDSFLPKATASPLLLLLGAALLLLVVACANVTNLLVARAADRSREIAVRTALGASRGRIARLLLVEALMLGAMGSAAGLFVARWVAELAVPLFRDFGRPVTLDVALNWRVMLFAAVAGIGATLVAGVLPIARLRSAPASSLGDGGRGASAGVSAARVRRGLVVVQFALSLALVVAAVLLVRTLENLRSIPTGLDVDHVALFEVSPEAAQYNADRIRAYYAEAMARLRSVPGVRAAGYGRVIPLGFGGSRVTMSIPASPTKPGDEPEINYNVVSPSYFDALGVSLVDGRLPDETDVLGRPVAAVVNETMARRYWPGARSVGQTMHYGDDKGPLFEVAGVVRDVKYRTLREESGPSFYYSVLQAQRPRDGVMHVRTIGDPSALIETLRRALAAVDPAVPVTSARTLRSQLMLNVNDDRVATTIGLALALAALLLAAVGLYGAMSYSVAQRRREIGIRLALGAVPADVRRVVLGQGLRLALFGSALGVALGYGLGQLVETRLFGVKPGDPASFALAAAVLTIVALIASWAPARRAMRVDPAIALRQD
jgi:predicted permease